MASRISSRRCLTMGLSWTTRRTMSSTTRLVLAAREEEPRRGDMRTTSSSFCKDAAAAQAPQTPDYRKKLRVVGSKRESHVLGERERRKEMNQLFARMEAVLPEPPPKMTKPALVDEVLKYIQELQVELEDLSEKRKAAQKAAQMRRALHPTPAPNVAVTMCGSSALVTVISKRQQDLFSKILHLVTRFQVELVGASVSTASSSMFHHIHIKACKQDFSSEALEEALRQLVSR
ncbi:transcription factor bHLH95 [Selaginella moellendorffii]|uniref:transcription factor bHLH95 n=1 Tax=Selaginella moellendorffii TaxID=88036 RepID=UPI000D1C8AFA|nr:transcription factor bHLH95 [Selaginella moellendorffii]|eukprot:XP_002963431.2 transcription factor bHLH95 [Selaginella moellendorffii]